MISLSGQLETSQVVRRWSGSPSNVSNGTSGAHNFSSRAQLCTSGLGQNGWGEGYLGGYRVEAAIATEFIATLLFTSVILGITVYGETLSKGGGGHGGSSVFGLLLAVYGNPEIRMMLSGYLGLLLMAATFLAIGTLISSFTDNVVIAYVGTLFTLLVLYTIGWLGETIQGVWAGVVRYVSITDHFQELTKGIIDTKDLVYFGIVLVVTLFLTHRSVESVRWR